MFAANVEYLVAINFIEYIKKLGHELPLIPDVGQIDADDARRTLHRRWRHFELRHVIASCGLDDPILDVECDD